VDVEVLSALDALPHFNPDLDVPAMPPPPAVLDIRRRVGAADALIICSPEYAHGVPGTLKNALDWLVSAPEVFAKPVALLNASPRSWRAQASLAETLRTMAMRIVPMTSISVPVMGRTMNAAAIAKDPELAAALRGALDGLVRAARAAPSSSAALDGAGVWGDTSAHRTWP
jgi:NAD(P)H-dependent FMN reductase